MHFKVITALAWAVAEVLSKFSGLSLQFLWLQEDDFFLKQLLKPVQIYIIIQSESINWLKLQGKAIRM